MDPGWTDKLISPGKQGGRGGKLEAGLKGGFGMEIGQQGSGPGKAMEAATCRAHMRIRGQSGRRRDSRTAGGEAEKRTMEGNRIRGDNGET